ncbi:MAG: O-antigen ligase family protein [Armatimonadota bacterium]
MQVQLKTAPAPVAPSGAAALSGLSAISLGMIGLFGFLLPVMRLLDFAGGRVNASAADLLILPVLFVLRGRLLHTGSLGYWLLALWTANLVSWALSISLLAPNVFQRQCITLATCYLYALAGYVIGRGSRSRDALVRGLLWSAIPMAGYGIIAFFVQRPDWFFDSDGTRVAGTFGDANAFPIYLAVVLPLVASAGIGWLTIPVFIGAGVVSFSRSGLAALGASLGLGMAYLGLKRYLLVVIGCVAIFLAVYSAATRMTTVGRRLANYQGSLEERQSLWNRAFEVASRHPVFGIGKGNWEEASRSRILPHNTFLSVMADGGLVGFGIFMIPIGVWVVRGLRRPAARPWAIAVCAGMVGGLAVSLDNFRPFWLVIGVLAAQLSLGAGYRAVAAPARARGRSPLNRHWS